MNSTSSRKTFYGMSSVGDYYLNGAMIWSFQGKTAANDATIRKKIDLSHFKKGDVLVDVYFSSIADGGVLKIKRVGYSDKKKYEVYISGLNKCTENINGWIPHFLFNQEPENGQKVKVASIPASWYGIKKNIDWSQ